MTTLSLAPPSTSSYGVGDAIQDLRKLANAAVARPGEAAAMAAIRKVGIRQENWDGRGSEGPSGSAILRAMDEVRVFIKMATASGYGWQQPLVGSNEWGEISFEWWRHDKKLTLYIGAEESNFVCCWGDSIDSMDAGVFETNQFLAKWRWLIVR